jgi:hypothetical protein
VDGDKAFVTVVMEPDMKNRIIKAAARNSMSVSKYMRMALTTYMQRAGEWTIPGPKKGNG